MLFRTIKNLITSRYDTDQLEKVQSEVTCRCLKLSAVCFGILILINFFRYLMIPNTLFWYQFACYVPLVLIAFFFQRLNYRIKISIFIWIILIVAAFTYYHIGVMSYSSPMLIFVTMITLFVLGIKWTLFYMSVGFGLQVLFFWLYNQGFLNYQVDVVALSNSPIQWMVAIGSHVFISLTVLTVAYGIYRFLEESMYRYKSSSIELEKKNQLLREEMIQRKMIEDKLRQTQKLETLGTLSGGIAHDFNNILTPIIGYTSLAIKELKDEDPLQEDLNIVLKGARRAKDLVNQILTFSRQQEMSNSVFDLGSLADETIKFLSNTFPKNIEIQTSILETENRISGDSSQIQQVFINLLTNASQAIGNKNGTITFDLCYRIPNELERLELNELESTEYAVITIRDSGSGIDQKDIDQIFDPFFTTKAAGEGTGLGLSVVHGIVMAHKGAIRVLSEKNNFTEFKVYFRTIDHKLRADNSSEFHPVVSGMRILVIDDESDVTSYAEALLSGDHNQVTTFNNPEDALDYIQGNRSSIDLIITDMMMPKISGKEIIKAVRRINQEIPVILWSGSANPESLKKHEPIFVDIQILRKPFEKEELYRAIRLIRSNSENR